MNLSELLEGITEETVNAKNNFAIEGLALDCREVKKGFVFIALSGSKDHGLKYVEQAIKNGALAVVYDPQGSEEFQLDELNSPLFRVKELNLKLGFIADRFYQSPSEKIEVIGITGTNGKTTCSQFLLQLIPKCGVIGTLGWGSMESIKKTINTTPDALTLQKIMASFVTAQKKTVVMEVSSHGLQQGRVNNINFKGALFTNLSRDHLDYHETMEAYLKVKLTLFKQAGLQYAVVNADDPNSEQFLAVVNNKTKCWAYSANGNHLANAENISAEKVKYSLEGIAFLLCWQQQKIPVKTSIVGDFNLDNILAVITVLLAQGHDLSEVLKKTSRLTAVPGRMERFGGSNQPTIFVDYAHTPAALDKVLKGLKKQCPGKLWLVFGCGGNRDTGKRAEMGAIASNLADKVIITNDNPRFENEEVIFNDIKNGCLNNNYEVIQNREQAIQTAVTQAKLRDCVLVAGKGHEDYQDVNGEKLSFSDQDAVKQSLLEWP